MANERIFVLGVGAMKAGTTWLHSYIANSANASMGFTKEYHIWDAVYSPLCAQFKLERNGLHKFDTVSYLRYCMQEIPGFYECYFNSIFVGGARITGDITPSYAALSEKNLRELKEKIERTGAKVKCVFLMRDPVERCWSAVRMELRKSRESYDEEAYLRDCYSSEQFQVRTRYEVVCPRLISVFRDDELYFGFYETMFGDDEISRLSKFLGIPVDYEYRNKRINASPKSKSLSKELRWQIRDFYSETYKYCFEYFEETRLLWAEV